MRRVLAWARLSPSAWVGLVLLGLFVLVAMVGPLLAPFPPDRGNLDEKLLGSSARHLFGTDDNGVDLLSAMLHGTRMALFISSVTVVVCALVGVTLGTIAGYMGGPVDEALMRLVDVLLAFPGLLLNLAIVAVVKRPGVDVVVLAMVVNGWVGYARLIRGQVLSVREREFVAAARAVGAGTGRILWRHVVPNVLSPLIVQMTFHFGTVIVVEASLSFLGVGPQVGYTWGALLAQGTDLLWKTQRLLWVPGAAIALVVIACNLVGDGLRDRLDPRRR